MRQVTGWLKVWEAAAGRETALAPGALVAQCRIRRNSGVECERYVVEFESGGRGYECALFRFQPRTRPVEQVEAGEPVSGRAG